MIWQFFKKYNSDVLLGCPNNIKIPNSFKKFYSTRYPISVLGLLNIEGFSIIVFGIEMNSDIFTISGSFIDHDLMQEFWFYEDLEIIQIGYNEYIPNGGIFLGVGEKNFDNVFYLKKSVEDSLSNDIIKLADTFDEYMNKAEVYGLNFDEVTGDKIYTKLEIKLPADVNDLRFPWENLQ